jgi:gamma-glutamyltranspeptidase / glutathione hydrolase
MSEADWRTRAGTTFRCEKHPATGTRGMVVTNHPLASAASAEMLAAGGNAIDAAVAALFALTVVEPMMVGILGGGIAHIRLADGRHVVIDNQSMAPLATGPSTYTPDPNAAPGTMDAIGRKNAVGPTAVAAPGNLKGWCEAVARFGTFPLADVMEPAIRHASRGFRVTPYLRECVSDSATDMARDPEIAKLYLPDGSPIAAGTRLVTGDYAETLRSIAREGPDLLYAGALGTICAEHMARSDGYITRDDLTRYRTVDRDALRGTYRGFEIVGPPPPSSGPLHIIQMLNILEGYDIGALGFGSAETLHLLAEVLKIAFADRTAATADPAFVKVPVQKLLSKSYAEDRRARIDLGRAQSWSAEVAPGEGAQTTHLTVAEHANDQFAVRRALHRTWHRHDPQQLYVRIHAASGPHEFSGTGKAGYLVDVAGHAVARWAAALCPGPARRAAHLPLGDAGDLQSDRSRHERAGGGGGTAPVDPGVRRGGGKQCATRCADGVA